MRRGSSKGIGPLPQVARRIRVRQSEKNRMTRVSSLRLDRYFVDEISVRVNPVFDTSVTAFEGDLDVVPQHLRRGGDDRHELMLLVAFLPREGAETQLPYHVEMKGRAFFHFDDPDLPDGEKSRMIKLNGASILFGLLRAEVAHVPALGRYGPMLLPAVNLIETFRARSRELA